MANQLILTLSADPPPELDFWQVNLRALTHTERFTYLLTAIAFSTIGARISGTLERLLEDTPYWTAMPNSAAVRTKVIQVISRTNAINRLFQKAIPNAVASQINSSYNSADVRDTFRAWEIKNPTLVPRLGQVYDMMRLLQGNIHVVNRAFQLSPQVCYALKGASLRVEPESLYRDSTLQTSSESLTDVGLEYIHAQDSPLGRRLPIELVHLIFHFVFMRGEPELPTRRQKDTSMIKLFEHKLRAKQGKITCNGLNCRYCSRYSRAITANYSALATRNYALSRTLLAKYRAVNNIFEKERAEKRRLLASIDSANNK
jgi:hypothetical protein